MTNEIINPIKVAQYVHSCTKNMNNFIDTYNKEFNKRIDNLLMSLNKMIADAMKSNIVPRCKTDALYRESTNTSEIRINCSGLITTGNEVCIFKNDMPLHRVSVCFNANPLFNDVKTIHEHAFIDLYDRLVIYNYDGNMYSLTSASDTSVIYLDDCGRSSQITAEKLAHIVYNAAERSILKRVYKNLKFNFKD